MFDDSFPPRRFTFLYLFECLLPRRCWRRYPVAGQLSQSFEVVDRRQYDVIEPVTLAICLLQAT